jgi:hypothetical protein
MVNPSRHDHEIVLVQLDPDPPIVLVAHVKVAAAVENVANLFVLVDMLVEEHLDLFLVDVAHGGRRDGDLVAVPVAPLSGEAVHVLHGREVEVRDSELREILVGDSLTGIMRGALIVLAYFSADPTNNEPKSWTNRRGVEPISPHIEMLPLTGNCKYLKTSTGLLAELR